MGSLPAIQEALHSASVSTVLDLTEVPYMDSAGLGVLTNAYVSYQKHGYRLVLVGVSERVQALLRLTRLDRLFEVYPTTIGALGILVQSGAA